MAYENMTYGVILQRMMDRVSTKYPNLDNREGSIIFNALAPAALELAIMYAELDNTRNESFVNTASRHYILEACKQIGMDISIFDASYGVHRGEFNVEVSIGSRWNCGLYNFTVIEYVGVEENAFVYQMKCETSGTAPNNTTGDLTPISEIPDGLSSAKLVECIVDGENETADEDIRVAYYDVVNSSATDGNVNQYKRWCNEFPGIGNYKIFPQYSGIYTVRVSILSGSNRAASNELISDFQEYLDPGITGMGDGVAPIGAFVTVATATEVPISVSADVVLKSGYTDTSIIDKALTEHFSNLAYNKQMVSYLTVGAVILSVEGVDSITNLTVNGGTSDISLGDEEIPVIGTTGWTVV